MNPELQTALQQAQAAQHQAELQMYFFGYTTYAAIIICAIFSILIFWKLRNIANEFRKFCIAYEMTEDRKAREAAPPHRSSQAPPPDERYMPKS